MVAWPIEFTKVSKKIVKGSIDPSMVETRTCVARVLKFSGECAYNWGLIARIDEIKIDDNIH